MYVSRMNSRKEMNSAVAEFKNATHGDPPIRVFATTAAEITDNIVRKEATAKFAGKIFKTIDEIVYYVEDGKLEMVMVGTLTPLSKTWAETMAAGIFAPIEQLFALADGASPGRALN